MMEEMRAIHVQQLSGKVSASLVNLTVPKIDDGEVLIEVHYSSLNYKDALAVSGPSAVVRSLPLTAGVDAAGIVVQSASEDFQPGDAVLVTGYELSQTHDGGYAEYLAVPADWVVPLPKGLSLSDSMALGTAGFTAALAIYRLLQNDQLVEHGPILVSGATGGVGSFAINILSALGYEVAALTGKAEQYGEYLQQLGAQHIVDRHDLDYGKRPLERALWGGAIDNLGGDVLVWLTRTVRSYGNIASCGLAADSTFDTTVMPFILRGVSVLGIASSLCVMPLRQKLWQYLANEWKPHKLAQIADKMINLEDVIATSAAMLAGDISGRHVVKIKP